MNSLRLPVLLIAAIILPSVAFAAPSCVLREYADQDHELYFYVAADRGFVFGSNPDSGGYGGLDGYSNIGVWVDQARQINSDVDQWLDQRGHVHTVAILQRQLNFNAELVLLPQWNGNRARLDFDSFGRPSTSGRSRRRGFSTRTPC